MESQALIISMRGCMRVQALQDQNNPALFFTYSLWENEEALNAYRSSERFSEIWSKTKVLFAEKPEAWSLNLLNEKAKL